MDRHAIFVIGIMICSTMAGMLAIPNTADAATTLTLSELGHMNTMIAFAWSESSDLAFQHYDIYMKKASDALYGTTPTNSWTDKTDNMDFEISYIDGTGALQNLQPSTNYNIKVRDVDNLGYQDSNELTVTTCPSPVLTNTSISSTSATLTWTDPSTYGAAYDSAFAFAGYEVYRSTGGGPWSIMNTITNPTAKSWVDSTLTAGTRYDYYVNITSHVTETAPSQNWAVWIHSNTMIVNTPKITVTSPNGGESWEAGKVKTITWTSVGTVGNVKIELVKGVNAPTTIISSCWNNGSYSWTIPTAIAPGSDYKIRISDISTSAITDDSDAAFTITAPSITVVAPNGGEEWEVGSSHTISWTAATSVTNVKIDLYRNDTLVITIAASVANNGNYSWAIPSTLAVGSDYSIKVSDTSDATRSDDSSTTFKLIASTGASGMDITLIAAIIGIMVVIIVVATVLILKKKKVSQPPNSPPEKEEA